MKINIIVENDVPPGDVHILCNKEDKPKLILFYLLCNNMNMSRIENKDIELITKLIKEYL